MTIVNSEFVESPKNFLDKYIVIIGNGMKNVYRSDNTIRTPVERTHKANDVAATSKEKKQNIIKINLVLSKDTAGGTPKKEGVVRVDPAKDTDLQALSVYWLAYESDRVMRLFLSTDCQYMFTATMDGCVFGKGSQPDNGNVLVTHANKNVKLKEIPKNYGAMIKKQQEENNNREKEMTKLKLDSAADKINGGDKNKPMKQEFLESVSPNERLGLGAPEATVVGYIDSDKKWKFIMQKRDGKAKASSDKSKELYTFKANLEL